MLYNLLIDPIYQVELFSVIMPFSINYNNTWVGVRYDNIGSKLSTVSPPLECTTHQADMAFPWETPEPLFAKQTDILLQDLVKSQRRDIKV